VTGTLSNGGCCVPCLFNRDTLQSLETDVNYLHNLFSCVIKKHTCDGADKIRRTFLINTPYQILGYFPNKNL
jgi:hypothetical protein